jgi:hypothetical protein
VFIVALGVIALTSLPVEKYPDIAPSAINVWASYPGASAETDTVPKVCLSLVLRIFQFKSYFPKYSLGVRPVIFLKRRVK